MESLTEKKVELGKRYKFPQLSTRSVEVTETVENYIEFYEKEFIWVCEYVAIVKDEEDPETKQIRDIEKRFAWRNTATRVDIGNIDYVYYPDSDIWKVGVSIKGSETTLFIALRTREKAHRMYSYFCQYKGFEHY